jgi:hypothetical protein
MGALLHDAKFNVLFNPTGIVFDPLSIAQHLSDYVTGKQYQPNDLFQHNELWHSWLHHSQFSAPSQTQTFTAINESICISQQHLQSASHLFITLGTAFSYSLKSDDKAVANCHKAPKEWFAKRLLSIDEMVQVLKQSIDQVKNVNPPIEVVFTVSPVKHLRDGIIENVHSKARLLEVVHQLQAQQYCTYFPAYELVTEVLRDYRFYKSDMAHPNEQSIQIVFDHLCETFLTAESAKLVESVMHIIMAKKHKPIHVDSTTHQQFLRLFLDKTMGMQQQLPQLNWEQEINYFSNRI